MTSSIPTIPETKQAGKNLFRIWGWFKKVVLRKTPIVFLALSLSGCSFIKWIGNIEVPQPPCPSGYHWVDFKGCVKDEVPLPTPTPTPLVCNEGEIKQCYNEDSNNCWCQPITVPTRTPLPIPTSTPSPVPLPTIQPTPEGCLDTRTIPTDPKRPKADGSCERGFVRLDYEGGHLCVIDFKCEDGNEEKTCYKRLWLGVVHFRNVFVGDDGFVKDNDRPDTDAYCRNILDGKVIIPGIEEVKDENGNVIGHRQPWPWERAGVCRPVICPEVTPTPIPTPAGTPSPGVKPVVKFFKIGGLHQDCKRGSICCQNPEDGPKFRDGNVCEVGGTLYLGPREQNVAGSCDPAHYKNWESFCNFRDWDNATGPVVRVDGAESFKKDPGNPFHTDVHFRPGHCFTICGDAPKPFFTTDGIQLEVQAGSETCTKHCY